MAEEMGSSGRAMMRAVVNYGVRDYRCERVPVPIPNEDEILVRVLRCGVCAGDAKCFAGALRFWGGDGREPYVQTPVIPGHEFFGVIVAMGPRKKRAHQDLQVGDRVIAEQVVPCEACLYCKKDLRWLCEPHDLFGFHTCVNGGFAQFMIFPARAVVHKIPEELSAEDAVYIEPLSCGVHGVERAQVGHDDVVVVSGCGAIGLGMIAYLAVVKQPVEIIALDCINERLELAKLCGATRVLNPSTEDAVALVKESTDGYGCDCYLEATGNPVSVIQGIKMIRKRGRFVEYSLFKDPVTLDFSDISDLLELDLLGAHCSGSDGYKRAIALLQTKRVPVEKIVTHALPLDQVVEAIEMVNSSGKHSIKVTLDPWL